MTMVTESVVELANIMPVNNCKSSKTFWKYWFYSVFIFIIKCANLQQTMISSESCLSLSSLEIIFLHCSESSHSPPSFIALRAAVDKVLKHDVRMVLWLALVHFGHDLTTLQAMMTKSSRESQCWESSRVLTASERVFLNERRWTLTLLYERESFSQSVSLELGRALKMFLFR